MRLLFALSIAVLAYAHLGYPLVAFALARLRPRRWGGSPTWRPFVSIVVPVRDESRRLCAKLESILDQPWPRELLEILIVDDGSSDDTAELGRIYEPWNARLIRLPTPSGKAVALNVGALHARGDVLVFTDARQALEPHALPALLAPLADQQVGAVSGELSLSPTDGARGLGLYRRFDDAIRRAEALSGSSVGVTGALWAVRRELWRDLPPGTILDDLAAPLEIARQGRRVVIEPLARVRDVASPDPSRELRRRARTLAGTLQLLRVMPWVLTRENPLLFRFVSHKLARLAAPLALVGALVANVTLALADPGQWLWAELLAVQLLGYGLALVAQVVEMVQQRGSSTPAQSSSAVEKPASSVAAVARAARSFVLVHVAGLWALWAFLRGREQELWLGPEQPVSRRGPPPPADPEDTLVVGRFSLEGESEGEGEGAGEGEGQGESEGKNGRGASGEGPAGEEGRS